MVRTDTRATWKCVVWVGPDGQAGNGQWRRGNELAYDEQWCAQMDALYPGWTHSIAQRIGRPPQQSPVGWELHPLFGNMESPPMQL